MSSNARMPKARRSRYTPPEPVIQTTVASVLAGRLPLVRNGDQSLDPQFNLESKPLWCAGNLELLTLPSIAIVGTRQVSTEGAARARRLARELARRGVVVVSGLAKGVDFEALTAAIEAGGRVVAIIGTSIDRAYPIENAALQMAIARSHLLISQFPSGARTFPGNFPERNRVMAALTDATVIVEAGETSGTLHQAAECVRLDRWLFIAQNVMNNPGLSWPAKFASYAHTRTLVSVDDLNVVLPAV